MLSCDTFALGKDYFTGHQTFLCKNSDRPLGEAQPLLFAAAADHAPGETLRCTHLTLPQAEHTYAVLGSKPYWIWGFEMGANEKGLFIGNEAQGSRCPAESEEGLLGMDLLRLALERTATAREAIDLLGTFLSQYGQNANANVRYDRRYENSYLLVDPEEIWLMETAGRQWAAKKIPDWAAISNCYTIADDYDLCSEDMERVARDRRYLSPSEPMHFAKAYTLPAPRQSHAVPRWRRMCALISAHKGPLSLQDVKQITRDHHDGEIIAPRFGACCANFISICMHAQDANSSQTAASMLFCHDDVLGMTFRYAPSIPCCSVFLPVYFTGTLPAALAAGDRYYDENSLWWNVERLSMAITADEERFGPDARAALLELEQSLEAKAADAEAQAKRLLAAGDKAASDHVLNDLTQYAVTELLTRSKSLSDQILRTISASGGLYGPRKEFLEEYCTWAHMTLA